LLVEQPGGAGLDEDHVDGVAGGIVEVAGDASALLSGGQAPLALGLPLDAQRALLELGEPLAPEPRAVPGEPGRRPDGGPEEKFGRELAPGQMRPEQDDDAGQEHDRPSAGARLVTPLGDRVERDREADRRAEAVSEPVDRRSRRRDEGEHGKRREPARDEW
jgi:hypothetical protein